MYPDMAGCVRRTSWTPYAGAHARGVIFFFTRPGPGSGAREGSLIAHQAVNAARTYVVSVEDLETLISEARHLASEGDASDRLRVVVDERDLDVELELELARATGGSGSAPAGLEGELLADAYRLSHGLDIADSTRDAYLSDWADLVSFLTTHRLPAQLPIHHAVVVLYLSYLAHHGTLMGTIDRGLAAIRFIHEQRPRFRALRRSLGPCRRTS